MTPDEIHVTDGAIHLQLLGQAVAARLAIDGASLVLDTTTEFGRVPILQAPADGASRFTAVELWTTGARFTAVIAAP